MGSLRYLRKSGQTHRPPALGQGIHNMLNTKDLNMLRKNDRDTFVLLSLYAKEANDTRFCLHSKWSHGFKDGFAHAYRMLKSMKVGVSDTPIHMKEKYLLNFHKYDRKIEMLYPSQRRRAARKALKRLAK